MTIEKLFNAIAAVVPSTVIAFVSSWTDLFKMTSMLRPAASTQIANIVLAFAAAFAVIFALVFKSAPPAVLKIYTWRCVIVAVILALASYACAAFLSWPRSRQLQEVVTRVWDLCAFGCIAALIFAILFATLFALASWAQPS